jgi:hypothetical protein
MLRTSLILSVAALLSACGQSPDSIDSILSVSLDDKPIASQKVSLRCSYAWAYFSEMDMASHYKATAEPAKAPRLFVTLPDSRLLFLTPEPWPPVDSTGRCNLSALHGWQALVFDPLKPVPLLTLVSKSDESTGSLSGLALQANSGNGTIPAAQATPVPLALKQAVEKASSLDFVVIDVSRDDDTAMSAEDATALSAESVSALLALPAHRPSILLPTIPASAPLNPDDPGEGGTLVGLHHFDLAKIMGANALSTYPSMPGLPITIDPNRPSGEGKVYFPSDVPTPSVTLPELENPLPIAPVAAVWYPVFQKLIVIRWTRRSGEVAKLID